MTIKRPKTVWMLAPTIRPDAAELFRRWMDHGYHVAAQIDPGAPIPRHCSLAIETPYEGYARAINRLWRMVAPMADVIIAGSDDLSPCEDRSKDDLLADFFGRFPTGFGVMHLARHDLSQGKSTDHCWMGAEYARRINAGGGPYWPEYFHYFDDTEAGLVADKLGVLWRRPELGQHHDHWTLSFDNPPPHLDKARAQWACSQRLFESRKSAGFPGHEPLKSLKI